MTFSRRQFGIGINRIFFMESYHWIHFINSYIFLFHSKNGEDYNTIVANNMGLIHFHVRHYAMAVRFFQHALEFDQTATENLGTDAPVHAIGASKRPEILYNLGIAMLHLQRPKEAFECFLVPLNYYHNNPKLWLRLAEACIMVHKEVCFVYACQYEIN